MNERVDGQSMPGGTLYVVATPIGNLADLSERARRVLSAVDLVACEDTRRTRKLLSAAGVSAPDLLRVDDHTEMAAVERVIAELSGGGRVALVTDAGTPGVADPGHRMVQAVIDAGFPASPVPGPSSVLAALVVSGLPMARFVVEGFLPRKGPARRARLDEIARERRTVVLLESPHRLAATMTDLAEACGAERPAAVARELTKLHEEVLRGPLGELAGQLDDPVLGEVVVVIGPAAAPAPATDEQVRGALRRTMAEGFSTRDAVDLVTADLREPRRRVYDLALEIEAMEDQ